MGINRRALVSIFIILMVGLSSTRVLDDYVDDYTTESIKNAAITYATARGINALVSMLQSSEVEAGVGVISGSVTIGELLDPFWLAVACRVYEEVAVNRIVKEVGP